MISVNVRVPEGLVKPIDAWVKQGKFASRSDAIKSMIAFYEEREKTRQFLAMLDEESEFAEKHPEKLIPLDDL